MVEEVAVEPEGGEASVTSSRRETETVFITLLSETAPLEAASEDNEEDDVDGVLLLLTSLTPAAAPPAFEVVESAVKDPPTPATVAAPWAAKAPKTAVTPPPIPPATYCFVERDAAGMAVDAAAATAAVEPPPPPPPAATRAEANLKMSLDEDGRERAWINGEDDAVLAAIVEKVVELAEWVEEAEEAKDTPDPMRCMLREEETGPTPAIPALDDLAVADERAEDAEEEGR